MKSKENAIFAKNNYMLLRCNVEEWAGFPQRVRESLLSTRRMSRITARPGNKSRIYYSYPDGHRRGNLHPLIIDATPSEINTASELPLFNDFCEFEVYENDRLDGTTYIMNIKAADILRITAYDNDHCFLYVHHNEVDVSRYLVRYGLESIYNILIGGSTTTGEDFDWSSYWTTQTKDFNMVIEGHSFFTPSGYASEWFLRSALPITYYNNAVSGSRMAQLEARAAALDARLVTETATYKNILVLWVGVNETDNTVGSGTTCYNALKSYVQDRVDAGWGVFVYTMTPTNSGGRGAQFEIERDTFNGLLRSDLSLIKDSHGVVKVYICDTDTISELDDYTNTNYYQDGIHPTDLGYKLAAELFGAQLDLLFPVRNTTLTLTNCVAEFTLTPSGDGSGVATMQMGSIVQPTYVQLVGGAKFYTDSGGTLNESDLYFPDSSSVNVYVRCTTVATLKIHKHITAFNEWTGAANTPSISGDIGKLTGATFIQIRNSNAVSGSMDDLSTSLTRLMILGNNTVGGDIGRSGLAEGITMFYLVPCKDITYTPGVTWSNAEVRIDPSSGGLNQTGVGNIILDMSNSASGPTSKVVELKGANASMADTTQGGIWGDFDGETTPSALAIAFKNLSVTRACDVRLNGITEPGATGDGTGFPAGFGNWWRS